MLLVLSLPQANWERGFLHGEWTTVLREWYVLFFELKTHPYGMFFADWNNQFTTKCVSCQFAIDPGDRWVEALGNAYHSECFSCSVSL